MDQLCAKSTYIVIISPAAVLGSESNEIEAIIAPIVIVSKLRPVKSNLLGRRALVISVLRAGVADIGTPPLIFTIRIRCKLWGRKTDKTSWMSKRSNGT